MNQTVAIRKHFPGCYRVTLNDERFAQIVKGRFYTSGVGLQDRFVPDVRGKFWSAEIRETNGSLIRFSGVWNTLAEAVSMVRA